MKHLLSFAPRFVVRDEVILPGSQRVLPVEYGFFPPECPRLRASMGACIAKPSLPLIASTFTISAFAPKALAAPRVSSSPRAAGGPSRGIRITSKAPPMSPASRRGAVSIRGTPRYVVPSQLRRYKLSATSFPTAVDMPLGYFPPVQIGIPRTRSAGIGAMKLASSVTTAPPLARSGRTGGALSLGNRTTEARRWGFLIVVIHPREAANPRRPRRPRRDGPVRISVQFGQRSGILGQLMCRPERGGVVGFGMNLLGGE